MAAGRDSSEQCVELSDVIVLNEGVVAVATIALAGDDTRTFCCQMVRLVCDAFFRAVYR